MHRMRSAPILEAVNEDDEGSISDVLRPVMRGPLFDTRAIATTDPLIMLAAERASEWKRHPESTLCVSTLQVAPYGAGARGPVWHDDVGMSGRPGFTRCVAALVTFSREAPRMSTRGSHPGGPGIEESVSARSRGFLVYAAVAAAMAGTLVGLAACRWLLDRCSSDGHGGEPRAPRGSARNSQTS